MTDRQQIPPRLEIVPAQSANLLTKYEQDFSAESVYFSILGLPQLQSNKPIFCVNKTPTLKTGTISTRHTITSRDMPPLVSCVAESSTIVDACAQPWKITTYGNETRKSLGKNDILERDLFNDRNRKVTTNRVSFSPEVDIQEIPSHREMSVEEKDPIWLSPIEFLEMRQSLLWKIKQLLNGELKFRPSESRGLEAFQPQQSRIRHDRIQHQRRTVLDEQDIQTCSGSHNCDMIATVAQQGAKDAVQEAQERALLDREAADAVHREAFFAG